MSDDATPKALEQVARQQWELNPLRARYRVVGPAARVERMLAAGLPLEFDAVSVGLRDGGPQVAIIPLDESSVEAAAAIAALPELARNAAAQAGALSAEAAIQGACEAFLARQEGHHVSEMEVAARADGLEGRELAKAMLTYAHAKAVQALWAVEDALRVGHLAGDAAAPLLATRDRAVEAKTHAERALQAQDRWLGRRT